MDDKRFDDIIKDKIGEYEPEGYDPSALAGLHYRMAHEYQAPWYAKYRSEMFVAAAAVIIALILLWGQWGITNHSNELMQNQLGQLQNQNRELLSLKNQLNDLSRTPDTVRVVEYRNDYMPMYANLMAELRNLRNKVAEQGREIREESAPFLADQQLLYMGKAGEIPIAAINSLNKDHDIIRQGEYLFLVLGDELAADNSPYIAKRKGVSNSYILPEYYFVIDSSTVIEDNILAQVEKRQMQISVKKMRDIEKHYQKGMGIELGPVVEFYRGNYTPGTLKNNYGGGVMANFITSPTLGVNAGVLFHNTEYNINGEDITKTALPQPNSDLGEFQAADIKSWFFEIPVALNYRYRLDQKHHLVFSGGLSALLYTKQSIEYSYTYNVSSDFTVPVESSFREKDFHWHLGTANASIGLSRRLNNNKRLEASLFYKHGLSEYGIEETEARSIGLRATYNFTLR